MHMTLQIKSTTNRKSTKYVVYKIFIHPIFVTLFFFTPNNYNLDISKGTIFLYTPLNHNGTYFLSFGDISVRYMDNIIILFCEFVYIIPTNLKVNQVQFQRYFFSPTHI